jgi:GNAT superfamily N-acetyltransferase
LVFKRTASGVSPSHQPHTNLDEIRSGWDLDIANDVEHGRWEAIVLNDTIGEISYRFVGGRLVLLSTWVDRLYRQQRIATELIARVLDEIRDSGNTQTSSTKSTPARVRTLPTNRRPNTKKNCSPRSNR